MRQIPHNIYYKVLLHVSHKKKLLGFLRSDQIGQIARQNLPKIQYLPDRMKTNYGFNLKADMFRK